MILKFKKAYCYRGKWHYKNEIVDIPEEHAKRAVQVGYAEEYHKPVDYDKYTYRELQKMARDKGIKASGKKLDIIDRLEGAE